jgi:hypothetical protein
MSELDAEFSRGSIKILVGLYLWPASLEIPSLPSVEAQQRPEQTLSFQSRVTDLKLRRQIEQKPKIHTEQLKTLRGLLSDADSANQGPSDLTERFTPAPAPRRDTPKWVEVEETAKAKERAERAENKKRRRDFAKKEAEIERPNPEFQKRVLQSEVEGQMRARKRVQAMVGFKPRQPSGGSKGGDLQGHKRKD